MSRRTVRSTPVRSREDLKAMLAEVPWGTSQISSSRPATKRTRISKRTKVEPASGCGECGSTEDLLVKENGWARCGPCRAIWSAKKNAHKVSPDKVHELIAAGVELPDCRCGSKLELEGRRPPALFCNSVGEISGGICRGCLNVYAEQKRQAVIVAELQAGATVPSLLQRGFQEAAIYGAKASMSILDGPRRGSVGSSA